MSNINRSTVRKYLVAGVAKQAGVEQIQRDLENARGGMYTCAVQAAISCKGEKEVFIETIEALMNDFRSNSRGIAAKYDIEQAKDKQGNPAVDGEGNPRYKVPSSLSTAKSSLARAFDYDVDLGTIAKPNSFSSIRDAASVAADEYKASNASPDDKVRAEINVSLTAIQAQLAGMDSKSLAALNTLLAKVATGSVEAATASKKAPQKAESKKAA